MLEPPSQPTCRLHQIHRQSPSPTSITKIFPRPNGQETPKISNGIARLNSLDTTNKASLQCASLPYSPYSLTTVAVYPHTAYLPTTLSNKIVLPCWNKPNIKIQSPTGQTTTKRIIQLDRVTPNRLQTGNYQLPQETLRSSSALANSKINATRKTLRRIDITRHPRQQAQTKQPTCKNALAPSSRATSTFNPQCSPNKKCSKTS